MSDEDIVPRLLAAAVREREKTAVLLKEAADTIETLRVLVGIREEVELEDAVPAGNA
ncbi:hypothetical protein ACFONL_10035 [Camelimonas fluminis]|uniref:Uncharacterized protein n=1 Tax=Camelimonas fluminis TaxID=1576911 RepID=A0ABV7UG74_9HYPH